MTDTSTGDITKLTINSLSYKPYFGMDDYVLYFHKNAVGDEKVIYEKLDEIAKKTSSMKDSASANQMDISVVLPGIEKKCRGLACRCHGSSVWSLAIRLEADKDETKTLKYISRSKNATPELYGFEASSKHWPNNDALFSIEEICAPLFASLLEGEDDPHGIIIITGSTGSAKSQIARGLIHKFIEKKLDNQNSEKETTIPRPHIITIEKPLESYFIRNESDLKLQDNPVEQQKYGIDFTPRLLESDTDSVEQALEDALRQKPTVVFLDEVRRKKEWESVLRFAGSGHLIITTAHAGSLVEAMSWIFESVKANSPAKRGALAERILGLVHLRRKGCQPLDETQLSISTTLQSTIPDERIKELQDFKVCKKILTDLIAKRDNEGKSWLEKDTIERLEKSFAENIKILFPTTWTSNPKGISSLVADGFSSIAPNNPPSSSSSKADESSLGRRWFILRLLLTIEPDLEAMLKSNKTSFLLTERMDILKQFSGVKSSTITIEKSKELTKVIRRMLPHEFFTQVERLALDFDQRGS